MKINITNTQERVFDGDVLTLPVSYLKHNATHLFIVSNKWDELHVDLTEDIPLNVLKYVVRRCKSVTVTLPSKVTPKIVDLMCELYDDKKGKIRKQAMMKRDIMEVID